MHAKSLRHQSISVLSFSMMRLCRASLLALLFMPASVFATVDFLTDSLGTFSTDASRSDSCGSCHAAWTGGGSRGDTAFNYKLWDNDIVTPGFPAALLKIDPFNAGQSIDLRVTNQSVDTPFPFIGAADKDGDGYISWLHRTERAGLPVNPVGVCSTCTPGGGTTGQLATPPLGWDLDDNDATINVATGLPMGAVPWSWATVLTQTGANAQEKLSLYNSTDVVPPSKIADLRVDIAAIDTLGVTDTTGTGTGNVTIPPNALPIIWSAPADDDPAIDPVAPGVGLGVHNYDLRFTTETVLDNYNATFTGVRCSATPGVVGAVACDIRNPDDWYTLTNISDCGISTGSGQTHLTPTGVIDGLNSNACASGANGWNRGEATPLMRGLYEGGFGDAVSEPAAPASPGTAESYLLEDVTVKHVDGTQTPYPNSGAFRLTDIHDSALDTGLNYIAADTVYWLTMMSDDGTKLACVESTGDERLSTVGPVATNFCQPDAGDLTIWGGPFTEADGGGVGFHSYTEPGFQYSGNIVAMKSGGGVRSGIAIASYSPTTLDAYATPNAVVTIDGIGFVENLETAEVTAGAKVVLTSVANGSVIESDGLVALDGTTPDRKMTVTFPIGALLGDYTLEIRDSTGKTVAAWVNAITITTTDPGTIRLVPPGTFSILEDAGPASIAIERTGGSVGSVSVQVDTSDGTATLADNDYMAVTATTITWADGVSGQQTVPVTITPDSVVEPDETVTITLSNATGTTLDNLQATEVGTLTIVNDDLSPGTLEFSAANYSVSENGGLATITVNRVNGADGPVSVDVASADGTAQSTEPDNSNGLRDYEPLVATTLVWGDQISTPQTFDVTINDDAFQESDETLTLLLSNTTGGASIAGSNPATLTILDNDAPTILQFDSSSYVFNEAAGTVSLNVVRTGNLAEAVSISFYTIDAGAETTGIDNSAGLRDVEPLVSGAQTVSWGSGVGGVQTLTLTINEDTVDELDSENFTVTLDIASKVGSTVTLGTNASTDVTITDNDSVLEFALANLSVNEGDGTVTIDVTRTDLSNTFLGALAVDYATTDNTALAASDYTATSGTLNWAAGDTVNTTQSFTVAITNDAVLESQESFFINLSNLVGDVSGQGVIGAQAATTVDIVDDEVAGQVRFVAASYSHSEDANGVLPTSTVTISVERVVGAAGTASVDFAAVDNTAVSTGADNTAGLRDYEPVSGTLSWADAESGIKTFTVTVNNDDILESPDEFLDLLLSAPLVNGIADPTLITGAGAQATATLTITDSVGTVQFSAANYSINEDGGVDATITVTRAGGSNGAVSVDYTTVDNVAVAGTDYTLASGTLSWLTGETANKAFTVSVLPDQIIEVGGELVDLTLTNPTGGAQIGTLAAASLTILDSVGTLQFDNAVYSVNEDGGVDATITVTRVSGSRGAASVDFAVTDGTAQAPADYTAVSGTLNWLTGDVASKTFAITIAPDLLIEAGGETVALGLANATGAALGTQVSATLTIIDSVGRVIYVAAPYSATEDTAGAVTITAQRIEGSGGQLDVPYSTSDGTATVADNDYTLSAGTLSWIDGQAGNQTFTITVASDRNIETDESLDVTISQPGQTPITTTLTILNDDAAGTVQLEPAVYNVGEAGVSITLNVTRVGGDVGTVTVDFATADGTAVSTGIDNVAGLRDFEPASNTLTWVDADSTMQTITITINDDDIQEGGEAFAVNLSNITGGAALGAAISATVTIADDDSKGTVQFSAPTYVANEDGGVDAQITVIRTGGSAGQIDVDYATADGVTNPANAGIDYTAQSGVLTWLTGDSTDRVISIPLINDAIVEDPDETVVLTLSNPLYQSAADGTVLGAQSTATLTIIDSYGQLQFSAPSYQVREGGGVDAVITVSRVGGSNQDVHVDYGMVDNTATAGSDYTTVSGTLSWADAEAVDKTFAISVADDGVVESPDELVDLTLSNPLVGAVPTGFVLGAQNTAALTIIDGAGRIQFGAPTYNVAEDGAGTVTLTVTRTGGVKGDLSVDYATADNTATAGLDYTTATGTLTWLDQDVTPQTIIVAITNDAVIEAGDEDFSVALSNSTLNAVADATVLGAQSTSIVTIVDSAGTVQFDAASYSVIEDDGDVSTLATITVSRVGGTNGAIDVDYATADNTALVGTDYTAASGTLSWATGDAASKTFTVEVLNDSLIETPDEIINLSLSNPVGAQLGTQSTAELTIVDSFGRLEFSAPTYSVNEDDGVTSTIATIAVTRTGGTNGAVSVDYATADSVAPNAALAGADYTAATGTLNWATGDSTSQTFTVEILNDAVDEDPDEILDLILSNPLGGAKLGAQSSAPLAIVDSVGTLEFSAPTFSVREDAGGIATISVTRVGGSNGAATIDYASLDADVSTTATVGTDYSTTTGTLTWADGVSGIQTFTIPVVNDAIVEDPAETVLLEITNVTGAAIGTQTQALLSIVDGAGSVQLVATTYSVDETGASVDVTLSRTGGFTGVVTVDYTTADGTATAGADYTTTAGTITWLDADSADKVITIPILDDNVVDGDEAFTLTLSNATGAVLGGQAVADITILENDIAGTLDFTAANYSVNEDGAGFVTISVHRSIGFVGVITVDFTTADVSAIAGSDYTVSNGTLTWGDGVTADQSFDVVITPDAVMEVGGEQLTVTIGNPTNSAAIGTQTSATITILDSAGSLEFSQPGYTSIEPSGQGVITVNRVGGSGGAIGVDYTSSAGTATAGSDYTDVSGTLTWADGNVAAQSFSVPVINDVVDEPDETVNLSLSNATGGATIGTQSSTTLTVISDDGPGRFQLSTSAYTVFENQLVATVTVSRVAGILGDVSVDYSTGVDAGASSAATVGVDYIANSGTLTWLNGDSSNKSFDIAIIDDTDFEPNETFAVTLSNPVGATLSTPSSAVVTIGNDDGATGAGIFVDPGWSMIAVPTLLTENRTSFLFGDDLVAQQTLPVVYRRVSAGVPGSFAGAYQKTEFIAPGEGYFIVNELSSSVMLDDQYNDVQTADPFEITLPVGGSMIGNPYATPKDLLVDARICNATQSLSAPVCSQATDWINWSTAIANGWVTGTIYRYNTANDNYDLKNPIDGSMVMNPWESYWFRTEVADEIRLRFYDQVVAP